MSQTMLNLALPDPLYKQLEVQAQVIARSVNELVVSTLTRNFLSSPDEQDIPSALQVELNAMENLSDEVLWQIAQSKFNDDKVALYDVLLERYHANTLTLEGRKWLDRLREESDALMLRKAHAYTVLQSRGKRLPSLTELRTHS